MSTLSRVFSEKYLRIGDTVVLTMDDEARSWGRKGVKDGTVGTVVGFTRYITYVGPLSYWYNMPPGKYEGNGAVRVNWLNADDQSVESKLSGVAATDLWWLDAPEGRRESRRSDTVWNEAFDAKFFLEPLPVLPFCEDDLIEVTPDLAESWDTSILKVESINYHYIGEVRNDGSPMPLYNVGPVEGNRGQMAISEARCKLHKRGNVWAWFNDKSQLKFASLVEEAKLHGRLGLRTQVRCPLTQDYSWPKEFVLASAQAGEIDVLVSPNGIFGAGSMMTAYRYHDRVLGEKLRALLVAGFTGGLTE